MSLVSIIVPAYNVSAYIERCVTSLIKQTHQNIQIIVVNDCSPDDTNAILMRLAAVDERVLVVQPEANVGLHAARAYGLKYATGDYIGFVDGDDWVAPDMYGAMLREMVETAADVVLCGAVKAFDVGQTGGEKVRFAQREVVEENILERYCNLEFGSGVIWNKLYRRDLILKFATQEWERAIDSGADYLVGFGCFSEAKRVVLLPETYYYYLYREDSMSQAGNAAANYSILFRAYARGCDIYQHMGEASLSLLDELYRRQLRAASYAVSDVAELDPFGESLSLAVHVLADARPQAIYEWMNVGVSNPQYFQQRQPLIRQWCRLSRALMIGCARRLKLIKE
jgi:glycosyltransferase involved in cell wall biosynthesis